MKSTLFSIGLMASALFLASCGGAESADKEASNEESTQEMNHDEMVEKASQSEGLTVPEGAKVYFKNLKDGDVINSPVALSFGVEGMEVEPAGELNQGMGHHHIIIDGEPLPKGTVVPADSVNIHYGKGQTEVEVELPPGQHTLTMQFADGYHQSYGEQMSAQVVITVNE
ncbi:MAG: DUF4399 domain-containing protein [Vicingaceae bacterium]